MAAMMSQPRAKQKIRIITNFRDIAYRYSISLLSYADESAIILGIGKSHCIESNFSQVKVGKENFRKECGCAKAIDIGEYSTCKAQCLYCYA